MIGVQVCEEQGVDLCEGNFDLLNALSSASTAIEKQFLLASFDQDTWSETIHSWLWGACTQERHFQILRASHHRKNRARN
jgi:hypothetical protein